MSDLVSSQSTSAPSQQQEQHRQSGGFSMLKALLIGGIACGLVALHIRLNLVENRVFFLERRVASKQGTQEEDGAWRRAPETTSSEVMDARIHDEEEDEEDQDDDDEDNTEEEGGEDEVVDVEDEDVPRIEESGGAYLDKIS